jgi:hypothetical protein
MDLHLLPALHVLKFSSFCYISIHFLCFSLFLESSTEQARNKRNKHGIA